MISTTSRTVARIRLRRSWTSYAALVVLISLAGGLTLGGIAGARRTATAAERFATETNAYDVLVNPDLGDESELDFDDVAALPMVEQAAKVDGSVLIPPGPVTMETMENWFDAMAIDDAFFRDISVAADRRRFDARPIGPARHLGDPLDRGSGRAGRSATRSTVRVPSGEDIEQLYTVQSQEDLDAAARRARVRTRRDVAGSTPWSRPSTTSSPRRASRDRGSICHARCGTSTESRRPGGGAR